ncbi:MAG: sodium-dependent transporter, partial [Pseudobdellovibrionaceae bacterium]
MQRGGYWRTKFGFYLLAVGSACSLGNIWRFPYIVGENGGGAFVLLYIFLAMVLGAPLLISELMLGKSTRKSVLTALETLPTKSVWIRKWVGRSSVILSLVVLSYYSVISGWVLHFLTQFLVGLLDPGFLQAENQLVTLMNNGWLQVLLASAHLL